MIQTKSDVVVQSHGVEKEGFFRISQSNISHILGILRNSMYSDKIKAVCREYMCNAADSHIAAGKPDLPIKVISPTALYPYFTVRDYGVGLTEEEVFDLFTSYGESTKRESNDYTGMLGIGSKSAFAYSDSFNVVSFKNGQKKSYTCYIDETEVGKVTLMSVEPCSDEDTGLEINVPVRGSDISSFSQRIKQVAKFFSVPPEVDGQIVVGEELQEGIKLKYPFLVEENCGFLLVPREMYVHRTLWIVMGNVAYPVPDNFLRESHSPLTSISVSDGRYQGYDLAICVPIGAVEVSASRESLSMTRRSKDNLTNILQESYKYIKSKAIAELNKAQSPYQAMMLYGEYSRAGFLQSPHGIPQVLWGPNKIDLSKDIPLSTMFAAGHDDYEPLVVAHKNYNGNVRVANSLLHHNGINNMIKQGRCEGLIINDLDSPRYRVRLNAHMESQPDNCEWFLCSRPKNIAKLSEWFAGSVVLLSQIEIPEKAVEEEKEKVKRFSQRQAMFKFNPELEALWEEADVDLDTTSGYYVPIHRFIPVAEDGTSSWWDTKLLSLDELNDVYMKANQKHCTVLKLALEWAKEVGMNVDTLYGVRCTKLEAVKGSENWKNFFSELQAAVEADLRSSDQFEHLVSIAKHGSPVGTTHYGYNSSRLHYWKQSRDGSLKQLEGLTSNLMQEYRSKLQSVDLEYCAKMAPRIKFFGLFKGEELAGYSFRAAIRKSLDLDYNLTAYQHMELLDKFAQYKESTEKLLLAPANPYDGHDPVGTQ